MADGHLGMADGLGGDLGTGQAVAPAEPVARRGRRVDWAQVTFWASLAVAVSAAGVAIVLGPLVGQIGAVLLVALAAGAMVLFVWLSQGPGRRTGPFPERGALEAAALSLQRAEYVLLDALDEPALVTDRHLSPITANAAYLDLAERAGALGESDRPPLISSLFGADPALSAPMFRLSKAASSAQRRRENLPATQIAGAEAVRFEAVVSPMPGGRVLWRLRPMASAEPVGTEDSRPLFIDEAPFGFAAVRPDGAVGFMNHSLRAVLGLGDEAPRARLKDFVKEDAARLLRRERRAIGPARHAVTLRTRDGLETQALALTVWPPEDAEIGARVFFFFSDLLDGELRSDPVGVSGPASAGRAAGSLFEHAPFGAAIVDGPDLATAAILDSNTALMEMTEGRAAPGVVFADLFDASEGPQALAKRLRDATGQSVDLKLATTTATSTHVQFAQTSDGAGIVYVSNVSEKLELQQRLAQSEKMREIGMLAGGVAHDFNNLLMVVMQNCDYLLRRHPVGDPDYLDLASINTHALRARELSEMLRAYARQQTFKKEVLDVSGFVAVRQELIRRLMGEAIKFEVKHGRDLPFIKADPTQLERVLLNLATNARDAMTPKDLAMPKEGALSIRTLAVTGAEARAMGHQPIEDGTYVMIEVEDSGSGIKPEDQAKIFRPFHSTKEAGKGTGLGLATSYGIIKQSEGYIFFDSKIGRGTIFRVFMPAYTPTAEELEQLAERERERLNGRRGVVAGRGRILLVEDEDALRMSISRNLVECGYEVELAQDGEEGIEVMRANPGGFDIIISDVSMPIKNGPEMLRDAGTELIGKAKVLFLSGYAPESFAKTLEEFPVYYMSKPVGLSELAQKVKSLLAA